MIKTEEHKNIPATLIHRITGEIGDEDVKMGVAELLEMLQLAIQKHGAINLIINAKGVVFSSLTVHKTWSQGLAQRPDLKDKINHCAFILDDSPNARAEKELMESNRMKFFFELEEGVHWLRGKGGTMRRVMMSSAMGVSALLVALLGITLAWPDLSNPPIISLIALMFAWAATEFYIGFSRPVEGIEPSHPLIKISRMAWLMFVVYSWLDFKNGWTRVSLPPWLVVSMLVLCCAALLIRLWAVFHLGKSFTYDVKRPAGNVLIRTGPYRFVRHPGYLGIIILATLPGLIVGSIAGFIGLLLATLVQTLMRVKAEDEMLAREFGWAFREYARRTRRLLPFVY